METTELRHAARRAYELGRVRFGAKLSAAALLAGGVAVGLGRSVAATVALSCALAVLVGLIAFRGGAAGRAIWPALAAGSGAMFFPLALATAGEALDKLVSGSTSLILRTDSEPFSLLQNQPAR